MAGQQGYLNLTAVARMMKAAVAHQWTPEQCDAAAQTLCDLQNARIATLRASGNTIKRQYAAEMGYLLPSGLEMQAIEQMKGAK